MEAIRRQRGPGGASALYDGCSMLTGVLLVLPLALETFTVAAALGVARVPAEDRLRVSLTLAGFEATAPVVGLSLGQAVNQAISGVADYVAIGVLLAVAGYILLAADDDEEAKVAELVRVRGLAAVVIGLSVSMDELAIGFTLGLLGVPMVPVILVVALQAFIACQLGLRLGSRLSERFREGSERLAGVGLAVVALVLLIEKLII